MRDDNFEFESLFEEVEEVEEDLNTLYERALDLEERLEKQRIHHTEIHFILIIFLVVIIDFMLFPSMQTFGGPLVIGVLEAVALFLLAIRMNLKDFSMILYELISIFGRKKS